MKVRILNSKDLEKIIGGTTYDHYLEDLIKNHPIIKPILDPGDIPGPIHIVYPPFHDIM